MRRDSTASVPERRVVVVERAGVTYGFATASRGEALAWGIVSAAGGLWALRLGLFGQPRVMVGDGLVADSLWWRGVVALVGAVALLTGWRLIRGRGTPLSPLALHAASLLLLLLAGVGFIGGIREREVSLLIGGPAMLLAAWQARQLAQARGHGSLGERVESVLDTE